MFTILLLFWSTLELDCCVQMHINGNGNHAITEIVDPVFKIYMTVSSTTVPISMSSGEQVIGNEENVSKTHVFAIQKKTSKVDVIRKSKTHKGDCPC